MDYYAIGDGPRSSGAASASASASGSGSASSAAAGVVTPRTFERAAQSSASMSMTGGGAESSSFSLSVGGQSPEQRHPHYQHPHPQQRPPVSEDSRLFHAASKAIKQVSLRVRFVLLATVLLQGGNTFILLTASGGSIDTAVNSSPVVELVLCTILQVLQLVLVLVTSIMVARRALVVRLPDAWMLYAATIMTFAGMYCMMWLYDHGSFVFTGPGGKFDSSTDVLLFSEMLMVFLYFSISTQTLVGFGDILPVSAVCQILSNLQMLVGVLYHVYIIAQTLPLFGFSADSGDAPGVFHAITSRLPSCITRIRRQSRRFLLLIVVIMQTINFTIIYACNTSILTQSQPLTRTDVIVLITSIVVQVLQVFVIVATCLKFVRKVDRIDAQFLLQAYLSMCVTFGGLYSTSFFLSRHGSMYLPPYFWNTDAHHQQTLRFWPAVFELQYFSISCMTTVGFGDVYPTTWHSRIIACVEMCLSVWFTLVIFGFGLNKWSRQVIMDDWGKSNSMGDGLRTSQSSLHADPEAPPASKAAKWPPDHDYTSPRPLERERALSPSTIPLLSGTGARAQSYHVSP